MKQTGKTRIYCSIFITNISPFHLRLLKHSFNLKEFIEFPQLSMYLINKVSTKAITLTYANT